MPPQRQHIVVITPDPALHAFMERALRGPERRVTALARREDMAAWLAGDAPDLVLLDLAAPSLNSVEVCRHIREHWPVPIIVFAAGSGAVDHATALNHGADDFLAAPFSVEELRARVRLAVERRLPLRAPQPDVVRAGALTIDLRAQTVLRNGRLVPLSRTDWAVLELLVRHAGQVLPYRTLLQHVWGDAYTGEIGYLRTYIKRLRDALENDPQHPQYVQTEARLGYRFAIPDQKGERPAAVAHDARPVPGPLLPQPLTSFVGREHELAVVEAIMQQPDVRLLTLTGPGGVGKTRLAAQVGLRLGQRFRDGICFVDLSHVRQVDMLVPVIALALGVKDRGDEALVEHLKAALRAGQRLLLLDNFEQVQAGASLVSELLLAAPHLKVLVTSRAPLHLQGEHEISVPPLALPDRRALPLLDELPRLPVVALFLDRARAVKPGFTLSAENAEAVADICVALDGLPLAVELAAARINVLSPQAIAARLSGRLVLLTGGARDLPPRQQTLRNLLDWSYNLLAPASRPLFARLAVFVGGSTLSAIEALWAAAGTAGDVLDGVTALVDASLLRQSEDPSGESRFIMLETIREYACEQLDRSEEADQMRQHHARYYLELAESAAPELKGAQQRQWLDRLERDHDNLRAALQWAVAHDDAPMLARFVGALWQFWHVHSHRREARRWVAAALEQRAALPAAVEAQALYGAGWLAYDRREYRAATSHFEASLALRRQLGDSAEIAEVLRGLGEVALAQRQYGSARALFEESLSLSGELGSDIDRAWSLHHLSRVALEQGALTEAVPLLNASLALFQELNDKAGSAWSVHNLGRVALEQGAHQAADRWLHESLTSFRELGDKAGCAWSLLNLGRSALEQGVARHSLRDLHESLALFRALADDQGIGWALYHLGLVALAQQERQRAVDLFDQSLEHFRALDDRAGMAQARARREEAVVGS